MTDKSKSKMTKTMNRLDHFSSASLNQNRKFKTNSTSTTSLNVDSTSSLSLNSNIDFDSYLSNADCRKLFCAYLKETSQSASNLLKIYLTLKCFSVSSQMDDSKRNTVFEQLHKCVEKYDIYEMKHINADLLQRLAECLAQKRYDAKVFNEVLKMARNLLESEHFSMYLETKSQLSSQRTLNGSNASIKHCYSKLSLNELDTKSNALLMPPPNPYHVMTKPKTVSAHDSEIQSIVSADDYRYTKNLHEMSSLSCSKTSLNHTTSRLPRLKDIKANVNLNKFSEAILPEFNPEQSSQPMKQHHHHHESRVARPLSESDPNKFADLLTSKLENLLLNTNLNDENSNLSYLNGDYFRNSYDKLAIPDKDLDTHIDEHINRVYNNNNNNNNNNSSHLINNTINKTQMLNNSTFYDSENPQHHFYKLTSTSKEVDIDHHTRRHANKSLSKSMNKSTISNNKSTLGSGPVKSTSSSKHSKGNTTLEQLNCDSGVSMRSAASIERVNDWLNDKKQKLAETAKVDESIKTKVCYYLPGEKVAFMTNFNGDKLTLYQFKKLITKKGNFRYFFKTRSDFLDGEECIVYQEATTDEEYVPMFDGNVIAKVENI